MGKFIIKAEVMGQPHINKQIEVTEQAYFPGTVLFFRSEDQAKGEKGVTDKGYTKDFGFDFYRPDLYGTHHDTKKHYPVLTSVKHFEPTTQKATYTIGYKKFEYQKTSHDNKRKAIGYSKYYMPWIHASPIRSNGAITPKTFTICAKVLLLTKEKKYNKYKEETPNPNTESIKFAIVPVDNKHTAERIGNNKTQLHTYTGTDISIDITTYEHKISKGSAYVPITIKVNTGLTKDYALVAYYSIRGIDYILGQANFWRPKVNEGEHSALDTYHRDNPDLPRYNPYTSIPLQLIDLQIKGIKAPALDHESTKSGLEEELQLLADQSGINVSLKPKVKIMTIDPVDPFLHVKGSPQINTHRKVIKKKGFYQINDQIDTPDFHYALVEKLFFSEKADKIHFINSIFKQAFGKDKLIVKRAEGSTPAIEQTLWEVLKENNNQFLTDFFSINFVQYVASLHLFCFISTAIHARKEKVAEGTKTHDAALGLEGRGITLVSNDAKEEYHAYLHEVAHNFGLDHTFDDVDINGQPIMGSFLKTIKKQTQENYMDYFVTRNSILKKQWETMHSIKINWFFEEKTDFITSTAKWIVSQIESASDDESISNPLDDNSTHVLIQKITPELKKELYKLITSL